MNWKSMSLRAATSAALLAGTTGPIPAVGRGDGGKGEIRPLDPGHMPDAKTGAKWRTMSCRRYLLREDSL